MLGLSVFAVLVDASMTVNNHIVKAQSSPQYSQSTGEQQVNQQLLMNGLFIPMLSIYYAKGQSAIANCLGPCNLDILLLQEVYDTDIYFFFLSLSPVLRAEKLL